MNPEILGKVKNIAAGLFGVPASAITAETSPANLEAWDSVQQLNLMLELEQQFGVRLEPEEMDGVRSIGDAVRIVQTRLG